MTYYPTKQETIKEIIKCGKNANYFINNYAKISHPLRGLIPFSMYDFQETLVDDFNSYRFNVILKARQLGISTVTAAYITWMMLFNRDKNILVIATKFGTAANLVKKVKSIIKYLPEWLRIADISVDNRTSFELSNGSQIKASSTSGDAGRSEALSLLVIDEAAHVDGLDELWTGLYPTLSTGGRCIALSTPNGVGNWFHQTYVDSENGNNDFFPTSLKWHVHPDRDKVWFDKETTNMSRRQIAQELECNFNMSGETVFHPDDIKRIKETVCEPKYRTGVDRNLWIWEEYSPQFNYVLSADVARGDGKDFSVFHIIKVETGEIIAEYRGKTTPDLFSFIINDAGREYGNCMVVVENNSVGFAVLDKLVEKEYPNLYYSYKSSNEYLDQLEAEYVGNSIAGFTTSLKTRPLIVAKMEEFVRNKLITVYSKRLLDEMNTFVWQHGKPQAMKKYNDDLIMACAIGCWVKDTVFAENQRQAEFKKAFLNSMGKTDKILSTSIPGMSGHRDFRAQQADLKKQQNVYEEFSWILKG